MFFKNFEFFIGEFAKWIRNLNPCSLDQHHLGPTLKWSAIYIKARFPDREK